MQKKIGEKNFVCLGSWRSPKKRAGCTYLLKQIHILIPHSPYLKKKSFHPFEGTMHTVLFENLKVKNARNRSVFWKTVFSKQFLNFRRPLKILCRTLKLWNFIKNHWSLSTQRWRENKFQRFTFVQQLVNFWPVLYWKIMMKRREWPPYLSWKTRPFIWSVTFNIRTEYLLSCYY